MSLEERFLAGSEADYHEAVAAWHSEEAERSEREQEVAR